MARKSPSSNPLSGRREVKGVEDALRRRKGGREKGGASYCRMKEGSLYFYLKEDAEKNREGRRNGASFSTIPGGGGKRKSQFDIQKRKKKGRRGREK